MKSNIDMLKQIRALSLKATKDLDDDALLHIPKGHNNHILWNLGHMMVTHDILCYKLANQPLNVSEDLVKCFSKGSKPREWTSTPDIAEVKALMTSLPEQFEVDATTDKFDDFVEYQTSTGPLLDNIDISLAFNNFHEGLHLGIITQLKKHV